MNGLDVAIAVSFLAALVGGYRTGLVARVASWAGLFLGLLLTAANLRAIVKLAGAKTATYRPVAVAALLIGGAIVGKGVGTVFGRWLHRRLPTRPLRSANRLGGAALGGAGVVGATWLVLPLLAQVPGWPAQTSRTSAIAKAVHDTLPAPPDAVGSLRRMVDGGRYPQVIAEFRRSLTGGSPPQQVVLDLKTQTAVQRATVSVTSVACGVLSDGSGFSVGGGRIVTNAHVVAGARAASVVDEQGRAHPATVVAMDAQRDLALLSVEDYSEPALAVSSAAVGDEVAVFGHPDGGSIIVRPAGVSDLMVAVGKDIYDRESTSRAVYVLAANLRPGDSGAAVVGRDGAVVGVAFAIAPDRPATAYALRADELTAFLDATGSPVAGAAVGAVLATSPTPVPGKCLLKR